MNDDLTDGFDSDPNRTDEDPTDDLTEFTLEWGDFEDRLAECLQLLIAPSIHGAVTLHGPSAEGTIPLIDLEGRFGVGDSRTEVGIDVRVRGQRSVFFPFDLGDRPPWVLVVEHVRDELRDRRGIAHPALLTATANGYAAPALELLGLPTPDVVLHEPGLGSDLGTPPDATAEPLRTAVERVLARRFGTVAADADGDYRVEVAEIGIYVSVREDEPMIRLWRPAVWNVCSRTAAVIEANYLNRSHPLTRWVLWGRQLTQEIPLPAMPFSPGLLLDQLDRFAAHYNANASALQLRLGRE